MGKSNRETLNAILYWLNTGIPWRNLPEPFGQRPTGRGIETALRFEITGQGLTAGETCDILDPQDKKTGAGNLRK